MHKLLNLGVLISGGGRTLQNLIDRIGDGYLKARIRIVISSHPEAFGLERARRHKIPSVVIDRGSFKGRTALDGFSQAVTEELEKYELDLVVMAGFNCLYRIPERYEGKVMNIHPALIPAFCGKGYYGKKVHLAVLEYGVKVTGCTVHFADNSYDHGPIILQQPVLVFDSDTPESLAKRVFEEECEAYPEAISLFQKGLLKIEGRRVRILLPPITPKGKVKKPVKSRITFAGTCRQDLRERVAEKYGGFEDIYR
ncbi:MAG TPA: phosphoribosylglycinamide formyltransferase, partial [Candidatus Tripitaka californicus]